MSESCGLSREKSVSVRDKAGMLSEMLPAAMTRKKMSGGVRSVGWPSSSSAISESWRTGVSGAAGSTARRTPASDLRLRHSVTGSPGAIAVSGILSVFFMSESAERFSTAKITPWPRPRLSRF